MLSYFFLNWICSQKANGTNSDVHLKYSLLYVLLVIWRWTNSFSSNSLLLFKTKNNQPACHLQCILENGKAISISFLTY